MISLNKISDYYKKIKNNFLIWLGVNPPDNCIINPVEEVKYMNKSEKDMLTDIIIDNHEEEFSIKEAGDDSGSHFAIYLPVHTDTVIIEKLINEKIKKRVIIIETPPGYINEFFR